MANSYFKSLPLPKKLKGKIYFKEGSKISDEPKLSIENLSRINIFVGPNNSGKSLIARELIKRKFLFKINPYSLDQEIKTKLEREVNGYIEGFENYNEEEQKFSELKSEFSQKIIDIKTDEQLDAYLNTLKEYIGKFEKDSKGIPEIVDNKRIKYENKPYTARLSLLAEMIRDILREERIDKNFKKIYIPTIRGLRPIFNSQNIPQEIDNNYVLTGNDVEIELGEKIYMDIKDKWFNVPSQRNIVEDYQEFLSENFFNEPVQLHTHNKSKSGTERLHIKIGKEKEQEIYNLGDGIQMMIILTFPFFKYESGLIVIEEPEQSIHPGLQKKLMRLLIENEFARNFQFFITTHSNHILDAVNYSDDISVFSVSKKLFDKKLPERSENLPDFIVTNLSYGNKTVLDLLGVSNTSVYLSNYSIWVEGMSDKLYIKKYLGIFIEGKTKRTKRKKLKEGIDYSFVFSGGSNIDHFEFVNENKEDSEKIFVDNLCGKAIVVVDGDGDEKTTRKNTLQEALGIRFIDLNDEGIEAVEIENLLPIDVIVEIVASYASWKNIDKASLIEKFKNFDYFEIRLGKFIDEILLDGVKPTRKKPKSFSNGENGTLKSADKVMFSREAIRHLTKDNITEKAKKLAENIYNIISKQK